MSFVHKVNNCTLLSRSSRKRTLPPEFVMLPLARTCAWRTARSSVKRTSITSPLSPSVLARLASTLAVLEQREGKLNASSLGAITAAQKIGGSIHGFVAGPKSVAEAVAKVKGLEKVLMVDNSAYDKVGHPQLLQIEKQPKQKLIYCSTGATRKLRPLTSRKHQEGRVYTYHHRPFSIWEEYPAQSSCIARCSANLGCYVD
jgi:hypothetical protein